MPVRETGWSDRSLSATLTVVEFSPWISKSVIIYKKNIKQEFDQQTSWIRHMKESKHHTNRKWMWPELETFNSHSTQQWSLDQPSDWQLITNRWKLCDTSFLLPLVCLLTQAEAWHSDKKLTKSRQGKMKNKNGVRYLDLIFNAGDCKVQRGVYETGGQSQGGREASVHRNEWLEMRILEMVKSPNLCYIFNSDIEHLGWAALPVCLSRGCV